MRVGMWWRVYTKKNFVCGPSVNVGPSARPCPGSLEQKAIGRQAGRPMARQAGRPGRPMARQAGQADGQAGRQADGHVGRAGRWPGRPGRPMARQAGRQADGQAGVGSVGHANGIGLRAWGWQVKAGRCWPCWPCKPNSQHGQHHAPAWRAAFCVDHGGLGVVGYVGGFDTRFKSLQIKHIHFTL